MIKVFLIGAGNVAVHMAKAMLRSDHIELVQRFSRNDNNNEFFVYFPFSDNANV